MTSAPPVVCTSVSRRRLVEARVLAELVAKFHGGASTAVLVVDAERDELAEEPFESFVIDDLPLSEAELHLLALCAPAGVLASALAPALLAHLLEREADRPVVYLDAATVICGPLVEIGELADAHGVVLAQRYRRPLPADGRMPDAHWAEVTGVIDPGLVVVGPGAGRFLTWWQEVLRRASFEEEAPIARRQPFLDGAVQLFAPYVLREDRYGLAAWNAHERGSAAGSPGVPPRGEPPLTARLEGFDRRHPTLLDAEFAAAPRVLLSQHELLAQICASHVERCSEASRPLRGDSRFATFADGAPVDARMRRLARRSARLAAALGEPAEVPDPFGTGGPAEFYAWLASPDPADPVAPMLPRYLREVHGDRADLRWAFPRVGTVDGAHFREWVEHHGLEEESVPTGLRSALAETSWWSAPVGALIAEPGRLRSGVTLAGYLRAEVGLGEAARLVHGALERAGIEVSPVVIGTTPSRQGHPFPLSLVADRATNVVWANADQLPGFASIVGPAFFAGRYTVGGWVWETERLPAAMAKSSVLVDEIWVPSDYAFRAIQPAVDRPVHRFPHPVVEPTVDPAFDRALLGVPDGFTFLFTYDFFSSFARKNPLGVLAAFDRAFAPGEGPTLVLKSVNGHSHLGDLEAVRLAARGRPDVVVLDGYLDAGTRSGLVASCDCFVSLHRAEGFGLGIAEAMALGRPVIATAYSGNLEYMDETTAYLVPAERVAVGPGNAPYEADDWWGEPDLEVAAGFMRRVVEDRNGARAIGERARAHVLTHCGIDQAVHFLERRYSDIEHLRQRGYVSRVPEAVAAWL